MAVAERFSGFHRRALGDGAGVDVEVFDLCHDADRAALWATDATNDKVRRYDEATLAHQQEYAVPAGFTPRGVAYDGTKLYVSNGVDTVKEFTIGASTLTEDASYDIFGGAEWLAWDGSNLWNVDSANDTLFKRNMDATLSEAASFSTTPDTPFGLVFVNGKAFTLEDDDASGYVIRERSPADMSLVATWPYTGDASPGTAQAKGLAFSPHRETAPLLNSEQANVDVLVRPSHHLEALVQPRLLADAFLPVTVTPRVDGDAHLATVVWPGRAWASLSSLVAPQFSAFLTTTLDPRFNAHLASTVKPTDYPVSDAARTVGSIVAEIVIQGQDFVDVSAEVGSEVTRTRGADAKQLKRIIQLVESPEARTYPRARTSEYNAGFAQDRLRRGDAVLYATRDDDFRPGDVVAWQGHDFEVVGGLGWHYVGNAKIYQEVGLRRLPVVDRARAKGVINAV